MPRYGTVNRMDISPHEPGRAFLAVHRYREDDWRPYVFRTNDYGESWDLLTDGMNGIPEDHWVRVVREDDVQRGLLYAGTEFGLFVSFDDGAHWQPLQMNLPATPIMDLKVHPSGDLAVATQGRSFWLLDDLTPLRELAAAVQWPGEMAGAAVPARGGPGSAAPESVAAGGTSRQEGRGAAGDILSGAPVILFTPRDVPRGRASPPMSEMDLNLPDPLPEGALLSYAVRGEVEDLALEVLDEEGDLVARWQVGAEGEGGRAGRSGVSSQEGFHRLPWPLRYSELGGAKAPPGAYMARISWAGGSQERPFRVLPDPMNPEITQEDYREQFRVTAEVYQASRKVGQALRQVESVKAQARNIMEKARDAERNVGALPDLLGELEKALAPLEARLTSQDDPSVPTGEEPPQGAGLDSEYRTLLYYLNSGGGYGAGGAEGRPTSGAMERKAELEAAWREIRARLEPTLESGVAAFNEEVARLGLEGIVFRKEG